MTQTFEALDLELSAALEATSKGNRTVRAELAFRKLLMCVDARASQLVVATLHGAQGPDVSRVAWNAVAGGLPLLHDGYVSQAEPLYSLAALCVLSGTVATFEAIALSGAPAVVPAAITPSDLTGWLDLVATTNSGRLTEKLVMMTQPDMPQHGVVGEIASFADIAPAHADEAFDVVWRLAPHHPGFDALAQESSEPGAAVRAFLMSKKMGQVSLVPAAAESPALKTGAEPPRRRRASV